MQENWFVEVVGRLITDLIWIPYLLIMIVVVALVLVVIQQVSEK